MELQFLGGAGEVGRSCVSLTSGETTVYLDCGLKMEANNQFPLLERAKRPQAVILSHSHLDHCGAIPALFKHSAPTVYCTTPTLSVSNVLYNDTIKIAQQQKQPAPFSKVDLNKCLARFSTLGYGNEFKLSDDMHFSFLDAGHIIGSAQIEIKAEKKKLVYTGDLKLNATRMHNGAQIPIDVDTLVMESTYGVSNQTDRQKTEAEFTASIQEVVDDGGTALVPCFAVGRTQEILTLLSEKNFRGDVFIDGMGTQINDIYYQYSGYLKNPKGYKNALQKATVVSTNEDRKQAIQGGNVIITTAGMLEGGPVLSYLQKLEKSSGISKIFLVGYQGDRTNGRRLLKGEPIIISDGKKRSFLRVSLPVKKFEFSAHASQRELLQYAKKVNPNKIFCVHGDDTQSFAELLKADGFNATAPMNGDKIKI